MIQSNKDQGQKTQKNKDMSNSHWDYKKTLCNAPRAICIQGLRLKRSLREIQGPVKSMIIIVSLLLRKLHLITPITKMKYQIRSQRISKRSKMTTPATPGPIAAAAAETIILQYSKKKRKTIQ